MEEQALLFNVLGAFLNAVKNEISIDKEVLKRINRDALNFTPIRPIKSLQYIDKYAISGFLYGIIAMLFLIFSPLYFLIRALKSFVVKKGRRKFFSDLSGDLVLVANSRIESLMARVNTKGKLTYLNINQPKASKQLSVHALLDWRDYLLAYFYAVCAVFYLFWSIQDKRDVLQAYVAYEWFLVYIGLSKIEENSDRRIYFANHYDRWATMFDQLFVNENVTLLQHGLLPRNLKLSYKLKHVNNIYVLNRSSQEVFKSLLEGLNPDFFQLESMITLTDIQCNKKAVLVIGQPHSIESEIKLIKKIVDEFEVFVKPHPLYDATEYEKLKGVRLIKQKDFYPRVDVALCYESTLGVEYEASGVEVVWWKGMEENAIFSALKAV